MVLKIAFDIGGVISKRPDVFIPMMDALTKGGAEVHVITDMHKRDQVLRMLKDNSVPVEENNVHCADYESYGELCKAVKVKELGIDLLIDDFPGYCAKGSSVRLFVWPEPEEPYWHDSWITTPEDGNFGRRTKKKYE